MSNKNGIVAFGIVGLSFGSRVYAQSAAKTVLFIALGLEPSDAGARYQETGNTINYKDGYGTNLNIPSNGNCKFNLKGTRFSNDLRGNVEYNIDFSEMSGLSQESFALRPNENKIYYRISGVQVCSVAALPKEGDDYRWEFLGQEKIEKFPKAGTCQNFLASMDWDPVFAKDLVARTQKAIIYFKKSICSGNAY